MSCSPDAFLVYGIDFGARQDEPVNLYDDIEESVYQHYKTSDDPDEPQDEYPDLGRGWNCTEREPTPEESAILRAYEDYWDAKSRICKEVGIDTLLTGSDSYPGNVLHCGAILSVEWTETADVQEFLDKHKSEESAMTDKLREFCSRVGLPFSEPKWLLATRYF